MTYPHLAGAARMAGRIKEIEATLEPDKGYGEQLQCGLIVATSAVASLEAYANDLLFEGRALAGANDAMASFLAKQFDRLSILSKFELVLAAANKKLGKGTPPIQNVSDLIELRNAVVHFNPEWVYQTGPHSKLSARLQNKFARVKRFGPEQPLFPLAWPSYSFASWAITAAVNFVDVIHAESGLDPDPIPEPLRPTLFQLAGIES